MPENSKLIAIGNMEDDLNRLKEVQWIIEVVVERLDIKKIVFEKLESVMTPGTLITSNTSGIPAKAMLEGRSENFRKHFAITHFFNPPRYMKLLEIVPRRISRPSHLAAKARDRGFAVARVLHLHEAEAAAAPTELVSDDCGGNDGTESRERRSQAIVGGLV